MVVTRSYTLLPCLSCPKCSLSLIGFHDLIFLHYVSLVIRIITWHKAQGCLGANTPSGQASPVTSGFFPVRCTGARSAFSEAVQSVVFATLLNIKDTVSSWSAGAPAYSNGPGSDPVNLILSRRRGTGIMIIRPGNFLLANHVTQLP